MDNLDRSAVAAGLGLLDLDRVFDAAREMIMDPQQCEGYLKWPAVAALGAIMAEPNLLSAVAEVALDGIAPDTYAGQKSWLIAQALFTASTAQAEYEIERGLALSPSDRTHINPKAPIAVQDYISRDEKLAVMKFYVMADTELSRIAMPWPAGPYGQFRIGDEGYVTDEQFGRVIPDPADQSLYEYISNGGALTDDVVHAAVMGNSDHIDSLASQAIENDPDAPVYYTEGALHTTVPNRTGYFHYGQA